MALWLPGLMLASLMLAVVALALWAVAAHGRVAPRWAVWLALGGLVLAGGLAAAPVADWLLS